MRPAAAAHAGVAVAFLVAGCAHRPPMAVTEKPARVPSVVEHRTSASATVARTTNRFDGAGRLSRTERDLDGDGRPEQVITYGYDPAGHLILVDEGERVLRYEVDATGRVLMRTSELRGRFVTRTEMKYDARGRLVAEDSGGTVLRYRFDDAGRLEGEQRFESGEAAPRAEKRFTYDPRGRRVAADGFDETGRIHQSWRYDRAGRVVSETLVRNGATVIETRTRHDSAGRRIGEEYRDGSGALTGRRTLTYNASGDLATDEQVDLDPQSWTRDQFSYPADR